MKQLRVTLTKSRAGRIKCQKTALRKLSLQSRGRSVIVADCEETWRILRLVASITAVEEITWQMLTAEEAEYMRQVIEKLGDVSWAQGLLSRISQAGGITKAAMPVLLEGRFAYELDRAGIEAVYEAPAEASSSVDFAFNFRGTAWWVEVFRLEETEAAKHATDTVILHPGVEVSTRTLSASADDERQSESGETLKVVQRISQKLEIAGRAHKFQSVELEAVNVLLVDVREFLNGDADEHDMVLIAYGSDFVPPAAARSFAGRPITGVFDKRTTLKGADVVRERVHAIGFVLENEYSPGSLRRAITLIFNPWLCTPEHVRTVIEAWPFSETRVIHGGKSSGT